MGYQTYIANASEIQVTVEIRHSGRVESRTISPRGNQEVHTDGQQVIVTLIAYAGKRCVPIRFSVDANRSVLIRTDKHGQLEIVEAAYGNIWVAK